MLTFSHWVGRGSRDGAWGSSPPAPALSGRPRAPPSSPEQGQDGPERAQASSEGSAHTQQFRGRGGRPGSGTWSLLQRVSPESAPQPMALGPPFTTPHAFPRLHSCCRSPLPPLHHALQSAFACFLPRPPPLPPSGSPASPVSPGRGSPVHAVQRCQALVGCETQKERPHPESGGGPQQLGLPPLLCPP